MPARVPAAFAATERDYTRNNPATPETFNLGFEKRHSCDNPKWNDLVLNDR